MPTAGLATGNAVMLDPERHWQCPSCGLQHVTREHRPHVPMHPCRGLRGILTPYVEVPPGMAELRKHSVRHVAKVREDFVGSEIVRKDADGRPIMAVSTERADGSNDLHVFAPTASGSVAA